SSSSSRTRSAARSDPHAFGMKKRALPYGCALFVCARLRPHARPGLPTVASRLVHMAWLGDVEVAAALLEVLMQLRVAQRLVGIIREQVLLGDIGDVLRLRVLGEQVVE